MHFIDLSLPTLAENLALDEALLLEAEEHGGALLRTWEWRRYAVILGAGGKLAEDVNEDACRRDGVEVARRSSGGGTVLLGPGCLLYSLVLSYESHPACRDVQASYRHVLGRMALALSDLCPGAGQAGVSDLACAGRKFSGNAQQRKRTHFLHHGTLLFGFDLARVSLYIKPPIRQPEYRAGRDHDAFLMNLPAGRDDLKSRLRDCWGASLPVMGWPRDRMAALADERYARAEWVGRR